jgi:inorganic pyrophosphatase
MLELDRVLYGPLFYPVNYCDVPGTWNEGDNDPLDAVLFSSAPITPGILARGRVIGMMEMDDNGETDHKIVCVNAKDPRYDHVQSIDDLTPYEKKDLKTFFELYKIPQTGKDSVKVGNFLNAQEAGKFIEECVKAYQTKFSSK